MAVDGRIDSRVALQLAADRAQEGIEELRTIGGSERTLELVREVERELRSMAERIDEGLDGHADPR